MLRTTVEKVRLTNHETSAQVPLHNRVSTGGGIRNRSEPLKTVPVFRKIGTLDAPAHTKTFIRPETGVKTFQIVNHMAQFASRVRFQYRESTTCLTVKAPEGPARRSTNTSLQFARLGVQRGRDDNPPRPRRSTRRVSQV